MNVPCIEELLAETKNIAPEALIEIVEISRNGFDNSKSFIEATGQIDKYLTVEYIQKLKLTKNDIVELIKKSGEIEKYLTPENIQRIGLNDKDIAELVAVIEHSTQKNEMNLELIEEILHGEDMLELYAVNEHVDSYRLTNLAKEKIASITNENDLIILANNHNWDEGYEIPREILKNKNCTLGVAILLFGLADGWEYYYDKSSNRDDSQYPNFIVELYNDISQAKFELGHILRKLGVNKEEIMNKLEDTEIKISTLDICKILL